MMQKLLFTTLLCVTLDSAAQESEFKISEIFPIETEHSYVGFDVQYMGYAKVRGRFSDFRGAVRFDERDLSKTSVSIRIDVGSIDTGNEWRDNDLRSDQWFDQKNFPFIEFRSQSVRPEGSHLNITGDLTIRGVKQTITFSMTYTPRVIKDIRDDSQIVFSGNLQINRIDFGVEGKRWAGVKEGITAVSDNVNLELTILGKRINAPNFQYWVADVNTPHGKVNKMARSRGINAALKTFDSLRSVGDSRVSVETLNTVGLMFLKEDKVDQAITTFKKNMEIYPENSLVYESYGEAMATVGRWPEAVANFRLALAKDPGNMKVKEILRHIRTK
jgi:polyisoprenoid-binding protein YceI